MIKSKALVFAGCASLLFATGCVKPTAMAPTSIADDAATPANRLALLLPPPASGGFTGGTKFKRRDDGDGDGGSSDQTASATGVPGAGAFPGPNGMMMPAPLMVPMMGSAMPGAMMMPPQMQPMMPGMMPGMMPAPMMPSPMMSAATLSNPMMAAGGPFVPASQGIGPNSPLAGMVAGQPNFNRQTAGLPQAANYSNVPSVNYPTGPALGGNPAMPLGSYSQFVRPTGAVYQITDVSNEPDLASNTTSQQSVSGGKETREKAHATGDVFMRSGPGKSYATQGVIKRGEVAQVQFCEGKWCKVTVDGKTGYASARFLNFFKD